MSQVQALYDAIKVSLGQDRRVQLNRLKLELETSSPSTETLLLGLSQSSSDVRQLVLGAIDASLHASIISKVLLTPIIDIIRQCLRAPSNSLSAIRLASSALKALSKLFKGNEEETSPCSLTALDMQSLVEIVLATMAWGLMPTSGKPGMKPQSNTRQWRSGPGSAFAFDRRDSQSSNWRGSEETSTLSQAIGRKSSSASLNSVHSEASASATSFAIGFETDHSAASDGEELDDGEIQFRKLRESRRGVRYRSISCIATMNEKYTRLLLIHWPRLLLDAENSVKAASLMDLVERDDILSNRIASVHAVQAMLHLGAQAGFMAGAEEGSRLKAFTSLSSRMASMIVDLRRRLLALMVDDKIPPSLLEAVLKGARTLVVSTPLVKLRVSHSHVLRESTLQLCSRPEASTAVPAYGLLSVLVASDKESGKDSKAGDSIISTIQNTTLPLQVRVEAWNTLIALAEKGSTGISDEEGFLKQSLEKATSPVSPLELRQAAANFVQACLSYNSMSVDQEVLEHLYNDTSAIIRSIAANCLTLLLPRYEERVRNLLYDTDSTVRASAVRAIGVKIQSEGKVILKEEICRLLHDESLLVRMRASWSLGNLCEVSDEVSELLSHCYSLKDDDERVMVNAIRGIGALLSRCPISKVEHQNLIESIFTWLLTALEKGGPKLRWNVSACLARSLTIASTCELLASFNDYRLASVLSRVIVHDGTFKVRLSAVQALLKLVEHKCLAAGRGREEITSAVETAIEKIGDQVNHASFKEAQLHAIPLQQSLGHLSKMLQSKDNF